ncbi:SRPBCC family protein [Parafrankia sp. FMc2]|uniref:SRPBCC family protein n=1 Tax=Parafrankia sp. FMc2 TaxID=3233196 RepID=UPI0034D70578
MVDILHRVGVRTPSPEKVYDALTTVEGLTGWWTDDTRWADDPQGRGDAGIGGVLEFRFPVGGFDMEVVELRPSERVAWRVVDGPEEWKGTTIDWDLHQNGEYTIVLFRHQGWKEPVEFMHHCSTKWGSFLMSLKSLVETGAGAPAPRDVPISDWH